MLAPVRRISALAAAALAVALLPVLVVPAPASAAPGCLSEVRVAPLNLTGCDDTTPPDTTLSVTPDGTGTTVTLTFTGRYTDAEATLSPAHPITFECRDDAATAWTACASGTTVSGLVAGSLHTFRVRAVDSLDEAIAACEGVCLLTSESVQDYDATPATVDFTAGSTTAPPPSGGGEGPQTTIHKRFHDKITPRSPVVLTSSVKVVLASSTAGSIHCALNAKPVACRPGTNVLKKLKPGEQVFLAQAVDGQGQPDLTPAQLDFFVPRNLAPGHGWSRVRGGGHVGGDYLVGHPGAVLTIANPDKIREVRLIAPSGPHQGTVAFRVGRGRWTTVRLTGKAQKVRDFVVRKASAKSVSGVIQIRAVSGAPAIDALVAR